MILRAVFFLFVCSTLANADQSNPLENLETFTAARMMECMIDRNNAWFCFEATLDECNAYVAGFAHNIYPCSTNTRVSLVRLVESKIANFGNEQLVEVFRASQGKGYEMCSGLDRLANEVGPARVSTHIEGCLNIVAILSSNEIWNATRLSD